MTLNVIENMHKKTSTRAAVLARFIINLQLQLSRKLNYVRNQRTIAKNRVLSTFALKKYVMFIDS